MAGHRINRISEDIKKELIHVMRSLKDPRVNKGMISVVRVDVTNDLSYAKVYISAVEGLETAKEAVEGLKSAAGYIRKEIGATLRLRKVPEFIFIPDDSIEYGINMMQKLNEISSGGDTDED